MFKITLRTFQSFYIIVFIFADYLPLQWLIVRRQFGILLSNIPYHTVFLKGYYPRNGYIFVGATELF